MAKDNESQPQSQYGTLIGVSPMIHRISINLPKPFTLTIRFQWKFKRSVIPMRLYAPVSTVKPQDVVNRIYFTPGVLWQFTLFAVVCNICGFDEVNKIKNKQPQKKLNLLVTIFLWKRDRSARYNIELLKFALQIICGLSVFICRTQRCLSKSNQLSMFSVKPNRTIEIQCLFWTYFALQCCSLDSTILERVQLKQDPTNATGKRRRNKIAFRKNDDMISNCIIRTGRNRRLIEYGGQCWGILIGHTQWPLGYGVEDNSIVKIAR